ncbi:FecR family protein [Pseudomonas sp. 8Z]|uniref:FecR domain-containing protein n=1 Tax=Pseudomonas sp. 8Z TaxID=2653166 RepID=UPI0012F46508|nr:FecR domain-containing protein [Pseudomonas sp. 8Z]VXC77250.1 FecR family protein [Pseudomonas sp. 8Z]
MGRADTEESLPPHAALEQAAYWYATLRDGQASAQARASWQAWLHADHLHEQAWRYVEGISRDFEPLCGRADARLAADALDVASGRLHSRRRLLAAMGAIAGGSLCTWLSWREALLPSSLMAWGADYRTGTGEQRQVTLGDGSQAWLNTASAVDLAFSAHARRVTLLRGEVFIATAKGASPFYVETEHGRMQALGTRFNVRHDAQRTWLAVYQGAVEIRTTSGASVVVGAGQQADFDAEHIGAVQVADAAREAWIEGTLLADNITLREVVQELRRYRQGHLGVADEVADLRVYGNFPVRDSERVLRMLASALPISIEQPLPWWASIEARH